MLWNVGKSDIINQFKFAFKQKAFPVIISFYAESLHCTGSNQLKGKLCQNVKIPCEKKYFLTWFCGLWLSCGIVKSRLPNIFFLRKKKKLSSLVAQKQTKGARRPSGAARAQPLHKDSTVQDNF